MRTFFSLCAAVLMLVTMADMIAAAPTPQRLRQLETTHSSSANIKAKMVATRTPVACSAQQTQGVCIRAGELFGSYNDTAATPDDCCAQCKKFSFITPQMPTPCANYSFNATSKRCSLHPLASRACCRRMPDDMHG